MRLKLTNIRQHASREFLFPDRGMVLVKGPSGAGKSTVFDAIHYALYGEARNLKSFGARGCAVELAGFGLSLKRTRNPNVLSVNDLEGEPAQGEIERVLKMGDVEFLASSYVEQDLQGSLLSLAPSEQLRLIQRLACGTDDPEAVKDVIRATIRKLEVKAAELAGQIDMLGRFKAEKEAEKATLADVPTAPQTSPAPDRARKAELERRLAATLEELAQVQSALLALTESFADPRYALARRLAEKQASLTAFRQNAARLEASYRAELTRLGAPWARASQEEAEAFVKARRQDLAQAVERERLLDELHALQATRALEQKHASQTEAALSEAAQMVQAELEALTTRATALAERERELRLAALSENCPVCATPLALVSGRLLRSESAPRDAEKQANEMAHGRCSLETRREALSRELRELETDRERCAALSHALGRLPLGLGKSEALARDLANWESYVDSERKAEVARAVANERIAALAKRLDEELAAFDELSKEALLAKDLIPLSILSERKATWERRLSELEQGRLSLSSDIREEGERECLFERHRAKLAAQAALSSEIEKLEASIAARRGEERRLKGELAAAHRLRELSDQAAADAVSAIVSSLNVNAQRYLEALFPELGTSVYLATEKIVQSGEKRARIDVRIFHKGMPFPSVRDLSGGERSRVFLAFQLALSEMYSSPLIMIDEGMKGLNAELKEYCLEVLRSIADDKLVLLIEHGAPEGMFDLVVSV